MLRNELASRLRAWRVRDHGRVAELAHATRPLTAVQRNTLASITKDGKALHDQAEAYREIDDNSGAIFIIEQVNDQFSFYDRFWKQIQRQTAGAL